MHRPWFGAKDYGIGLGPKSWQGWAAVAAYAVLVAAVNGTLHALHGPTGADAVATTGLTAAFLVLMIAKSDGKPWRWRWGGRD